MPTLHNRIGLLNEGSSGAREYVLLDQSGTLLEVLRSTPELLKERIDFILKSGRDAKTGVKEVSAYEQVGVSTFEITHRHPRQMGGSDY